ncbi:type II toxin-antitoxin system Phd/YefM family antitoxin [Bdellovibrionota bacterium FG-1]
MKAVRIARDIVPIAEFKAQSASWLDRVRASGQPVVITQNGRPAGVLISPEEFDRIQHQSADFVRSEIRAGEAAIIADKVYTAEEVKAHLETRRKIRKSKK